MSGRIVLIEGLDLAGKSTLVKWVVGELTSRGVPVRSSRNSLCPDNPLAALADRLRRDPTASVIETGALFLAAHLWDVRHFQSPPPGTVHVQDSCWLRTLAWHTHRGTPAIPALLQEAAEAFPRFHAAVFLTASVTARQRRLWEREREEAGANDADDHAVFRVPEEFLHREALLAELARTLTGAHTLDTTDLTPEEVLRRGLTLLGLGPSRPKPPPG
jgi:dTMP kinase